MVILIKKWGLLFLLLCLPYFIFTYISKGQHSFVELAVIGEKDHKIPEFSFLNQDSVIVTNQIMMTIFISQILFIQHVQQFVLL